MKELRHLRPQSALGLGLLFFLGCSTLGDRTAERPRATIESVFVDSDHRMGTCLHGDLAQSYVSDPDSVLFFDRDSKIRVTPPTKKGATSYHAHLLHRVGTGRELLDFAVKQDREGVIELDLGHFDQPEEVVITSAARRIMAERPAEDASALLDRPNELITPPYVLSFRLVRRAEQIETILSQNPHRYEITTEAGTLHLVVSSFSRRDQLLTFIDPKMTLSSLIAEDPYVYLQGEDGAIPPRITVEVLRAGSKDPWQKAATYHIPEAVDHFTKPSDRPFLFRTRERDLIAFAPPARVELTLPSEPPQTTAVVKAAFSGLECNDVIKFVIACAYPSGPKGDYAARAQSHAITAETKTETCTVDLGHLDPSSFPLVASIAHRLVTPWKLTGGRWAPEPAKASVTVPLAAPKGDAVRYSKLLAPKYASHFDLLTFLGAGSGKRNGSSILDSDLGRSGPDDPNVSSPPPPPGSGGIVPPPTSGPIRNGQGFGFGGPDSYCGCGKDGKACPNGVAPCKGRCGQACPANGCCKPRPNQNGGDFLIQFPCPPKGKSCGKSEADCKCGQHQWDKDAVRATILAALQKLPNFADLDGPNGPGGFAPCHTKTHVADVIAHFWAGGAVGIGGNGPRQIHVVYRVHVVFKPCIPQPLGGGGGINPGVIMVNIGQPGTSFSGGAANIYVSDPQNPISTTLNPTTDPNTIIDVTQASNALVGGNTTGGITTSLFASIIRIDIDTLNDIRVAGNAVSTAPSSSWLFRPVNVLNGPDSWNLSLPSAAWATYQQGTANPGGGNTTPAPPPPPPTETKPTRK